MADVQIATDPQVDAGVPLNTEETAVDEGAIGAQNVMPSTEASVPQPPTRLYFLRMPKPDTSDLEFRKEQLESELKAYKAACSKALAAAKLAHERKLQRKEEHSQASEQFQVSKQDRNTLRDRLRPVSDLNRQVRDQRRDINDRKSQLPASTVAELDQKIADLEFKQAHEPMDRKAENNLIADIRKLKKSRPEVARFEMEYQAVESHKDEVATFKSTKADLERQLDVVNEEFTLAKSQMDAKWNLYQDALEQHDEISKEFTRLKEHQEAKYKECKELRDIISTQQNGYYENRRFSQNVRTMLTKGQLDEAQEECRAVTEGHIATLLTDSEAWKEYVAGWELTRKYAVSQAAIDVSGPGSKAKSKKQPDTAGAAVANSDAIIAGIMAEIEGRAPAKSAAEVAAQSVTMPATEASAPKAAKASAKAAAKAAPAQVATPAAEAFMQRAAEESKAEKSVPAPAKTAAPPATEAASKPATKQKPRATPLFEEEPFVPPAMYLSKQAPEPSVAEQKAKIRQEQMAKAADAEARKKQQAERKVKKAEKAKEQAKQREIEKEQKKAVEKMRIEKEAAAQRTLAAKKKEAQQRKAAVAAERRQQQQTKTSRSLGVPKKVSKTATTSKLYQYALPVGAGLALFASAGMMYFFSS